MAQKYLDATGLAYFWSKIKSTFATKDLATQSAAGLMSSTDKAKVDTINNQGTIAYYKKLESNYVTSTVPISTIPVGISGYGVADLLFVDINGLDLVAGRDYVISGTNIILNTPIESADQIVHFVVLRATTATTADYSVLKGDPGDVSDVLVDGSSVVDSQGVAEISIQSLGLIDIFYPVGSYYETSDTTFDPNTAWGGTWVKDSAGKVTVAQDTSDTDFDTIGGTGGEKTHLLTDAESGQKAVNIGSSGGHSHTIRSYINNTVKYASGTAARPYTSSGDSSTTAWNVTASNGAHTHDISASDAATAHNNLQPYIVVNRWHRTA